MVTEAEILSIDYTRNTCTVRIPLFESVNTVFPVVVDAVFAIAPGAYNGYKEKDIVWVAFEQNRADSPVVIGKMYLGATDEHADGGGALTASDIVISNSAVLPGNLKITNVDDDYNSIQKIINKIRTADTGALTSYDVILTVKPDELTDATKIITLHTDAYQPYSNGEISLFLRNLYNAGYTSIDKYKSVKSDENLICGLFVTNENNAYQLYYVTSYSNMSSASGYLVQDWNQETGLMQLTAAQFTSLLDVLPHHAYLLEDENIISFSCLDASGV